MADKAQEAPELLALSPEVPTEGLPRPEAVNFTRLDLVGSEVQISLGYIDLHDLVGLIDQARRGEIREASPKVDITHRLVFGLEGFARLKDQVDQIAATIATNEAARSAAQGEGQR